MPHLALRCVLTIGLAASVSGCFFTPPTGGELGRAEFAYDEGLFGCLFGCDASEPMAAHANTFLLVVNDDELPAFDAVSSDRAVLEVAQDEGTGDASLLLSSHAAGAAFVVLEEPGGELIDRVQIQVHDVDRVELGSPEIANRYLIMVDGTDVLRVHLFDDQGRQLKGFGAVEYAYGGGIGETEISFVTALADAIASAFVGSTSESVRVSAYAVGAGSIDVTAPSGAALSIPVEVVDASAVASVSVETREAQIGTTASVRAQAFGSDGEEIHDPSCDDWTVATTSGEVVVTSEGRNMISVSAEVASSAQITCTVGSASGTGTIDFVPPEEG